MELPLVAHQASFERSTKTKTLLETGKKESLLSRWQFGVRLHLTARREELAATVVMFACGCALAGLLAVSNAFDAVTRLFRS